MTVSRASAAAIGRCALLAAGVEAGRKPNRAARSELYTELRSLPARPPATRPLLQRALQRGGTRRRNNRLFRGLRRLRFREPRDPGHRKERWERNRPRNRDRDQSFGCFGGADRLQFPGDPERQPRQRSRNRGERGLLYRDFGATAAAITGMTKVSAACGDGTGENSWQ